MFVITSLIVVLLYNGFEMQERSLTNQVGASNLFLYFLVPLFIFNYLGTMHHSEAGLVMAIDITFFVFLGCWVAGMAWWVGFKLFPERFSCKYDGSLNEPDLCGINVTSTFYWGGLFVPIIFVILLATKVVDFPKTFLFACIVETSFVIVGKGFALRPFTFCKSNRDGCCDCCQNVLRVSYVLLTLGMWIPALYFFLGKRTTDKVETPEKSRDLNQECYLLDFSDSHDIWHIVSSCALLMSALLVIHASYDAKESQTDDTGSSQPLLNVPATQNARSV